MRIGKLFAVMATLVGGLLAFAAPSSAAPIGVGAVAGVKGAPVAQTVQYYDVRPRAYRVRPAYGRPVYGRPVYGRPVYGRPVYGYRPARRPRTVCTVRYRVVPSAYGYVRRPVRVCRSAF